MRGIVPWPDVWEYVPDGTLAGTLGADRFEYVLTRFVGSYLIATTASCSRVFRILVDKNQGTSPL